jgi:protein-tyrosine phosphatase
VKERGIRRVCCLLSRDQLGGYQEDLLQAYRRAFGEDKVCWAPVEDFHLVPEQTWTETLLPFLRQSDAQGEAVVVHCSGGIGRTGHVLALWLAVERGYPVPKALAAVQETGRNPFEALEAGCATAKELRALFGAPA